MQIGSADIDLLIIRNCKLFNHQASFHPKPHQISIKHSACFSITSMLSQADDAEHFFNTEQLWILGQCLHEISLCSPLYHSLSSSFLFRAVS